MLNTHFCDDKYFFNHFSKECFAAVSFVLEVSSEWARRRLLPSRKSRLLTTKVYIWELVDFNFHSVVTHTGQTFPEGDFRMNRYLGGKKKALSARWAIDMIAEEPVIMSTQRRHMCDGTYGGLNQAVGHPRVWINLDDGEVHDCSYCGLRYQKK